MTTIILILLGLLTVYYIYRQMEKGAKEGNCASCKLNCAQRTCPPQDDDDDPCFEDSSQ